MRFHSVILSSLFAWGCGNYSTRPYEELDRCIESEEPLDYAEASEKGFSAADMGASLGAGLTLDVTWTEDELGLAAGLPSTLELDLALDEGSAALVRMVENPDHADPGACSADTWVRLQGMVSGGIEGAVEAFSAPIVFDAPVSADLADIAVDFTAEVDFEADFADAVVASLEASDSCSGDVELLQGHFRFEHRALDGDDDVVELFSESNHCESQPDDSFYQQGQLVAGPLNALNAAP